MTLLNEAECNLRVDHSDCIEDSLLATWQRTAWLLEDFSEVLGDECKVPYRETLNPPLWEIGHFNWFYEWFITRNPQWHLGLESHYDAERTESRLPHFDKVLDSSAIAHEPRWNEILPGRRDILEYQDLVHQDVLSCLNQARQLASEDDSNPDQVYYFFKLCLMHEQMHNEAAVFMAAQLGIPVRPEAANPRKASWQRSEGKTFHIPKQTWNLGWTGSGFCFDNEQPAHIVELNAFEIDASPVTWRQYIRFIQATEHPLPSGFQWAETQLKAKQFGHSRTV
ncbi:MAG: SUMF1/EgtB/PvdO family nonheme iron enzyme, partial [Limnobacter sp.]|nr:SUMF1/EgtB/PvdO family nonheme iron enzyme [Limnobacter sp.]